MVAFGKRIRKDVEKRPDWYFYRFEVATTKKDMIRFEQKELAGIMKDFLDWQDGLRPHYRTPGSCITKYGRCWGLIKCTTGSYDNLVKREKVFNELENL